MGKVHLITGGDYYAVKNKARDIVAGLCGKDFESNPCLEIIHGDSGEMKPGQAFSLIIESAATPAFLGSAKTIWLKNLDFDEIVKLKDSEEFDGKMSTFLALLEAGLADDTTLVMSVFSVDRRSKFFKICQKSGEIQFFEKMDIMSKDWNNKLRSVIRDSCRENEMRISEDAVTFVSETAGVDVERVRSEMDKLFAYVSPNTSISLADCKKICSRTPETAGWSFANALSDRNLSEAIETLNVIANMPKNPEIKIIYNVIGNFQDLVKIKSVCRKLGIRSGARQSEFEDKLQNVSPALRLEIKDESIFKLHPFRAWKVFSASEKFSEGELSRILTEILRTNKALVSGAFSPRMELEALAIKICRGKTGV
jgi:DNA polymerase III delta subunit